MKKIIYAILITVFVMGIESCTDDSGQGNPIVPNNQSTPLIPIINSINPTKGVVNTEVTIEGTNFAIISSNNTVKFNSITATIVSASSTSIVVKVPSNAGTGKVTVTTSGGTADGPEFQLLEAPTISLISPISGTFGTSVTIHGTGFETTASSNIIKFNGNVAAITLASKTQLVATVPMGAGNGKVTVGTSAATVEGPEFTYILTTIVSTFAGDGSIGFQDGPAATASFNFPTGLAIDGSDNIYVADRANNKIRKITPNGLVSTLAGNGEPASVDGNGVSAKLNRPAGLFMDPDGELYFTESGSAKIRKINVNGDVTTIAGTVAGYLDGPAAASKFSFPVGVVRDSKGNIFIADFGIHCIRKISNGEVSTFAGSPTEGNTDGLGVAAQFSAPNYMTIDQNDNLYVSEFSNNRIRKITPTAEVTTVTGGDQGFADGTAASAQFHNPYEIKFDKSGNLIICDGNNSRIRMLSPEGIVTTLAGNGTPGLVNGVGTEAQFQLPLGVAINSKGEIFLSDRTQRVIRKIEFK